MIRYYLRKVCETPTGEKDFHYYYSIQEVVTEGELDLNFVCSTHPTAATRDVTVEYMEPVV